MSLPSVSVRRPIMTAMVTAIAVLLGAVSLYRIQIDLLPEIELPTVTVATEYPGASPEVVEQLVTQIVEEIVATVPGVIEITSRSAQGNSNVRITFGPDMQIDAAALDVQSRLEDELEELPDGILRPRVRKFDIASFPVVILGVSSRLDPVELTDLVENTLRNRFTKIQDIAQVDAWGGFSRQLRIELKPERLKTFGVSAADVRAAVVASNLDRPSGQIEAGKYAINLRAPAEFRTVEEVERTIVAMKGGAAITIAQVADVLDTHQKLRRIVRIDGDLGLRLAIRKQAQANTVEVAQKVLAEVDAINAAYPQIRVYPVSNQGGFIERSIANVARSVIYGGTLAVFVLLFFLLSVRSTTVISIAIPIAIFSTFAVLYFFGLTINLTTLGGLALGVGMMVDSSIVVLENIYRRRDECKEAVAVACVKGAQEVAPAILASTVTTLVVFLPLGFVEGTTGILFRELAYVVAVSLVCSLVVSLTVLPMVCSRLLATESRAPNSGTLRRWMEGARGAQTRLNNRYHRAVVAALGRPALTVTATLLLFAGSLGLYPFIGTEFMPPTDEGQVRISAELEIGSKLSLVDAQMQKLEALVKPLVPEALAVVSSMGASSWRPDASSRGSIQIALTPASERTRSNADIASDLRKALSQSIAGAKIRVRAPRGSFLLERLLRTEEGLTVEIRGYDLEILEALAKKAEKVLTGVDGITDVELAEDKGFPEHALIINRAKVGHLGLTVDAVTRLLQTAVAGVRAGEFRSRGASYPIFVQLKDAEQRSLDEILRLELRTPAGGTVALGNLVENTDGRGPLVINRKDQQRLVSLKANISDRDLGSVAVDVEAGLGALAFPAGYDFRLTGAFEAQSSAFDELTLSAMLALLLVYMVLASQYESFRNPLVVMLSVPMATIGVLGLLLATDTTLNSQSLIGCIMLGGIVVNNAILLVDQAGQMERAGSQAKAAILEAGRRRLRPILMTTLTTILGLLPLALGIGEGADAQAPLARAVIGGLLASTPITLVVLPVVYLALGKREKTHVG